MQPVDRVGIFRAQIVEFGLNEAESGSVAINIRAHLTEWWDGEKWVDWNPSQQECDGSLWVVKKDGSANEGAAESLMRHAGWDASFSSVVNGTWKPTPCQVEIREDEYKQKKRKRIEFINDFSRTPGALSNVDSSKASDLDNRFGPSFRALAGNVMRNRPSPGGGSRPPAPPPPEMAGAAAGNSDGIPF
jgi:hypothetical protein